MSKNKSEYWKDVAQLIRSILLWSSHYGLGVVNSGLIMFPSSEAFQRSSSNSNSDKQRHSDEYQCIGTKP